MPTLLEDFELDEVSAVDRGANQHADLVLFKRRRETHGPEGTDTMENDDAGLLRRVASNLGLGHMLKADAEDDENEQGEPPVDMKEDDMNDVEKRDEADMAKRLADLEDALAKGAARIEALESELAKRDEEPAPPVAKADETEDPMSKALADSNAKIEALQKALADRDERDARQALAKSLASDGVADSEKLAGSIRALAKVDADGAKSLEEQVRALAKQADAAGLFKEAGQAGSGNADSATAKIESLAKRLRNEDPSLTEAQAFDQVLRANPDLYTLSLKEGGR